MNSRRPSRWRAVRALRIRSVLPRCSYPDLLRDGLAERQLVLRVHAERVVPAFLRPQLGGAAHAGPEHVPHEGDLLAQRRRYEHATRLVELTLDRRWHVQAPKPDDERIEARQLADLRLELAPRSHRVQVQARLEQRRSEDEAAVAVRDERVPIARGETDSPLGVDRVDELTAKHDSPLVGLGRHFAPLFPTGRGRT